VKAKCRKNRGATKDIPEQEEFPSTGEAFGRHALNQPKLPCPNASPPRQINLGWPSFAWKSSKPSQIPLELFQQIHQANLTLHGQQVS
jgi:hypothetical protein